MNTANNAVELLCDDSDRIPCCKHGPGLLFMRVGTCSKNDARPFYACSACRRRKDCNFFVWKDESSRCTRDWNVVKKEVLPSFTHEQLYSRSLKLSGCKPVERYFCCRALLSKGEMNKHHLGHPFRNPISDRDLRRPSRLLHADTNNATKAQYFFDDSCVRFLVDTLRRLDFDSVVCLGTPSLYEHLREYAPDVRSVLLDIEQAYEQFYSPAEFCWFNMFNNFHFRGEPSETALRDSFVSGSRCAIVVDPPFGGLVDAVARTLERIVQEATSRGCKPNVFWFFPYFNEKRITSAMPGLQMLDYAVGYENHEAFNASSGKRAKGSPVRIFTDVPLNKISLPKSDYVFCVKCDRWVGRHNRHCDLCNDCTSKDGGPYRHCDDCKVCVKDANEHCQLCDRCVPRDHNCQSEGITCFVCKETGHKSTACPQRERVNSKSLKKKRNCEPAHVTGGKKRKK